MEILVMILAVIIFGLLYVLSIFDDESDEIDHGWDERDDDFY